MQPPLLRFRVIFTQVPNEKIYYRQGKKGGVKDFSHNLYHKVRPEMRSGCICTKTT